MIVLVIAISIIVVCVVLLIGEVRRYLAMATNKQREWPPRHTLKSPRVNSWSIAWMISLTVLCLSIVAYGWLFSRALFLTIMPSPALYDNSCVLSRLQPKLRSAHLADFLKQDDQAEIRAERRVSFRCWRFPGQCLLPCASAIGKAASRWKRFRGTCRHWQTRAVEQKNAYVPQARGEFGEIERFFKTRLSQMASLPKDYERELAGIGWETILDPERLGRDPTLIMSNLIVQKAKTIVAKVQDFGRTSCVRIASKRFRTYR